MMVTDRQAMPGSQAAGHLVFIKLGGSVITDKAQPETARPEVITWEKVFRPPSAAKTDEAWRTRQANSAKAVLGLSKAIESSLLLPLLSWCRPETG